MTPGQHQTRIRETVITGIEEDDFSACDGEFYVRGYIRTIARAVGADPEPLIREHEAAQLGPLAGPDDAGEPVTLTSRRERRLAGWLALLGVALALGLCFAAVHFLAGWPLATGAAPSARARSVTHHFGRGKQATPAPDTTTGGAVAVRTLTPASAAAFGASGAGQGDNGDLARLAIDADPATAWHTDWYTSAHFGNLYPGTGLLVDMGRPVTITAARITLGNRHGAGLELRVGAPHPHWPICHLPRMWPTRAV